MAATAHTRTAMSPPPDTPQTPGPDEAAATAASATPAKPWTANALLGVLIAALAIVGGALAGLLVHEFSSIDERFAAVDARFAAVDARFARLEARMDARFTTQDAKINEINLKLTALIATLDKTDEVEAALTGEIAAH